jgi:diguanylate cyclase (GGDEF)-like protein
MLTGASRRAAGVTVVAAAVLAGWVSCFVLGGLPSIAVYEGAGYALVAVVVVGVAIHRPPHRWPWLLVAAAVGLSVTGDLVWDLTETVWHAPGYTASLASLAYLLSYPLALAGAIGFLGPRAVRRDTALLVDGGVLAVAAWLAIWVVWVHPQLAGSGIGTWDWLTTVAYPPLDVLLLVVLWRVGRGELRRSPSWVLLFLAFVWWGIADTLYAVLGMPEGTWSLLLSVCWLAGYASVAAAAIDPTMRGVDADPQPVTRLLSSRVRGVGLTAVAAVPLLLLLFWPAEVAAVPALTALGGLLLVAGGIARLTITIDRNRDAEQVLAWSATHDQLTGLANRRSLLDRLELARRRALRRGRSCALLFCDLDEFKVINDSLGHAAGDALLRAVAARLRDAVRADDCVARLGGDEFVLVCEDLERADDAGVAARRVLDALAAPFPVAGTELHVGASIGVVEDVQESSSDAPTVLSEADLAMYQAKARGRGRIETFEASMRQRVVDRLDTQNALRRALTDGEFCLHYQPIFSLHDGSHIASEALLRWQRPGGELVPPAEFVPVAEASGSIVDIGAWVLRRAAEDLRALGDRGDSLTVAVNLSVRQLAHPLLGRMASDILTTQALPPDRIVLEITESALLDTDPAVRRNLDELRGAGFRFSIDDFGTGYSSLSYLRRLAVDTLKVDRSFIRHLAQSESDETLVHTIVLMAHALNITVVAEGIEHPRQLEILAGLECDAAQGYLLGRPAPGLTPFEDGPPSARSYSRSRSLRPTSSRVTPSP